MKMPDNSTLIKWFYDYRVDRWVAWHRHRFQCQNCGVTNVIESGAWQVK
jgi:hypothetical protein